jgi:hypothetical protein
VAVDAVGTRTKELPLEQVQDIRIYIYISDAAAVDAVGTRRELPLEQVPYFYLDVGMSDRDLLWLSLERALRCAS